jgi:hypothetical protein
MNQLEGGGAGHIGANWVVKFAGKGPLREAPVSSIKFEFRTSPVGFPIERKIDILFEDSQNFLLIECKSVLPQNAFTSSNLRQFEFDLSYVENLDEIRWIFDGEKLPNGLNFDDFINSINVDQNTINTLLGRQGTIQELRTEIIQRGEDIFKVFYD